MSDTPLHIPSLVSRNKFVDYRDEIWGDSYNWSWNRPTSDVKYLVIHHTVTSHDATPDDIALLHKARGWAGIGYHFVITKDGTVWYVGDVGTARANVLDMNEKVIGITLVGDFTKHLPSDDQILSAHDLCAWFLEQKHIWKAFESGWAAVVGHKELQATECPGNDWKDTASSLYNRIKGRIPYSTPPQPDPTPEPPPAVPNPSPPASPPPSGPPSESPSQPPSSEPEPSPPLLTCEQQLTVEKQRVVDIQNTVDKVHFAHQPTSVLVSQIILNITGQNEYLKSKKKGGSNG